MNADKRRWNCVWSVVVSLVASAGIARAADHCDEISPAIEQQHPHDATSIVANAFTYTRHIERIIEAHVDCRSRGALPKNLFAVESKPSIAPPAQSQEVDFAIPFSRHVAILNSHARICSLRANLQARSKKIERFVPINSEYLPPSQPTVVERFIERGFPSGQANQKPAAWDDSYLLAEEGFTFGGLQFSR